MGALAMLVAGTAPVSGATGGSTSRGAAVEPPPILITGPAGDLDEAWTLELDGTVRARITHPYPFGEIWATIGGGLVAYTKHKLENHFASNVYLHDARTGAEVAMVKDARFPLIVGDGAGLMFLPDNMGRLNPNDRDLHSNSVWYRDLATGEEVRLARVFNPDHSVEQLSASSSGDRLAFTRGNSTFLREWNIWIVKPNGRGLRRLTTDDRSLSPAFSPDGRTIAMAKIDKSDPCGGSLATIRLSGEGLARFYHNTCRRRLVRPVWIDDRHVAALWFQVDRETSRISVRGLAIVDTVDGSIERPLTDAAVATFSVSRKLGIAAYRTRTGAISVIHLATGVRTAVPAGATSRARSSISTARPSCSTRVRSRRSTQEPSSRSSNGYGARTRIPSSVTMTSSPSFTPSEPPTSPQ